MIFQMDRTDLNKLSRFYKQAPREFLKASAGVINTLAFEARKLEIKEIGANMIIRNKKMTDLKNNPFFYVQTAKPVSLEKQIAIAGSLKKEGFSGWKEQEEGTPKIIPRVSTKASRGGSWQGKIKPGYRVRKGTHFYRPEQFRGKNYRSSFLFMMRVLNSRGGSNTFLLNDNLITKRGQLNQGLYLLKNHKIFRLQEFKKGTKVKHLKWRTNAINKLQSSVNIQRIWGDQITRVMNRYK